MNRPDLLRRSHLGADLAPPGVERDRRGRIGGTASRWSRPDSRRLRRGRSTFWVTVGLTLAAAFGAAAFHVLLVQSEFRLIRLEEQADAAERRYEQLRLEVAQLSSPERIVRTAQERLGMVVPDEVSYLVAPVAVPEASAGRRGDEAWSEVKPHLDTHR